MSHLPDGGAGRSVPKDAVIWARGLHAGYHSIAVLHGLDFEIKLHRTTAILGPGGGGKTTLLRVLNRQLDPCPVWRMGILVIDRDPVCWLPQKPAVSQRPVSDLFLSLAPEMYLNQLNPEANLGQVRSFCTEIPVVGSGIAASLQQPLSTLPPKWVRVAMFAAAMFRKARFLVLDEPEVDLHPEIQAWMTDWLIALNGGHTIVLATHNLKIAKAVADRVILLEDGVIVEENNGEDFFTRPKQARTQQFIRMGN